MLLVWLGGMDSLCGSITYNLCYLRCANHERGNALMDLFTELTRTTNATMWWRRETAAFAGGEPRTQRVTLRPKESKTVVVNGQALRIQKLNPRRKRP